MQTEQTPSPFAILHVLHSKKSCKASESPVIVYVHISEKINQPFSKGKWNKIYELTTRIYLPNRRAGPY